MTADSRFTIISFLQKNRFFRTGMYFCLLMTIAVFCCSCSERKKHAPVPKAKNQLLLEIYDAAGKNQYAVALQKIARFRALDPANAVIQEFEHMIRFNQLVAIVDFYLRNNNFNGAFNAVVRYEQRNGISKRTAEAKEQLLYFARMDNYMTGIKNARTAIYLEKNLRDLKNLEKEKKFPPKVVNFIRNGESKLKQFREYERLSAAELLCLEAEEQWQQKKARSSTAEVMFSVAEILSGQKELLDSLRGKYLETK